MDTSGECRKCQKRFAPDRLPPLTKYEASKLLLDRQKEKAALVASGVGQAKSGRAWLRKPLIATGWLLGVVGAAGLLHLVVIDFGRDATITAGVTLVTLLSGYFSALSLERAKPVAVGEGGRLAEVEQAITLLEDELEKLKKPR